MTYKASLATQQDPSCEALELRDLVVVVVIPASPVLPVSAYTPVKSRRLLSP